MIKINSIKIVLYLFIFFIASCSNLPKVIEPYETSGKDSRIIYVSNNGWHTGIILSATDMFKEIPELASKFKNVEYFEIGWGDAGFYQANEITTGLTLKAIFWPTETVVHVVGFSGNPEDYFSIVKPVNVSSQNIKSLLKFIQSSFARDDKGSLIYMRRGLYGNSYFYGGIGSYYVCNTCNNWTAKALYSAGVKISPALKLTSSSIIRVINKTDKTK